MLQRLEGYGFRIAIYGRDVTRCYATLRDVTRLEMLNVNGLTVLKALNTNNITTIRLPNNNSLTLKLCG